MIKKRHGFFSATVKGKKLLAPDRAGELYASLFMACFTRLNLAYLDRMRENGALQAMIAVPLHLLSGFDDTWFTSAELKDRVWPAAEVFIAAKLTDGTVIVRHKLAGRPKIRLNN